MELELILFFFFKYVVDKYLISSFWCMWLIKIKIWNIMINGMWDLMVMYVWLVINMGWVN